MKIEKRFKSVLLISIAVMFASGLVTWVLQNWFKIDRGFGPEPIWQELWALRMHAIAGLWFLVIFGYLFHCHVEPALKGNQKKKSGWSLLVAVAILIVTVPLLLYSSSDSLRELAAKVHTYMGLLAALPFTVHMLTKVRARRNK